MGNLISPEASLWSLFAATFLASTLIPLSSEVALFAVLKMHAELLWPALAVATLGNTLGGMSSYLIGRFIGSRKPLTQLERVRRWGAPVLLFAWLPLAGDALCVASGWLKLDWAAVMLFQAAGRLARYGVISIGTLG
jgi:membrane protein YqaA with SNARE-associated domain